MGRVLIEAMACGVPLVGSATGGIPFTLRDGECGYLFPRGDSATLEQKLRQLLADPALSSEWERPATGELMMNYNEKVYVEQFSRMVEAAVRGEP